jgi:hypothetical protein
MMLGYSKMNVILRGSHTGPMVCVEHVSTTIPKGGKIHKVSYFSFLFLTKIGSLVNFIARNVFKEIGKYKEVECK